MTEKWDLPDIAVNIHTALRKSCDNNQTSILYNAIEILPRDIWLDYCTMVKEVLDSTTADPVGDITKLSITYSYARRLPDAKQTKFYREASLRTNCVLHIFEITLSLCTQDDYENMLSYLLEAE